MRIRLDVRNTLLSWVIVLLLVAGFALPAAAQLEPVSPAQRVLNNKLPAYRLVCGEGHRVRLHGERRVHARGFAVIRRDGKKQEELKQAMQNCEDNLNAVLRAKTYCDPTACLKGDECWPASYSEKTLYKRQRDAVIDQRTLQETWYRAFTCTSKKPVYVCSACGTEPSRAVFHKIKVPKGIVKNFASSLVIPKGGKHPSVVTTDENPSGGKHPPRKKKPYLTVRPKGQRSDTTGPLKLFCSEKKANPGSALLKKVERGTRLTQANHNARWQEPKQPRSTDRLVSTLWFPGKGTSVAELRASIRFDDARRACTEKFKKGLKQWYSCEDDNYCAKGKDCEKVVKIPKGEVKVTKVNEVKYSKPGEGSHRLGISCELKLGSVKLKCECLDCPPKENPCFEGLGCLESGGEFGECSSEMSDVEFEIFDEFENCVYSNCDDREDEDSFFACASEQCGALADECESPILPELGPEDPVSPGNVSEDITLLVPPGPRSQGALVGP